MARWWCVSLWRSWLLAPTTVALPAPTVVQLRLVAVALITASYEQRFRCAKERDMTSFETFQNGTGPVVLLEAETDEGVWDEARKRQALLDAAAFISERERKWALENPSPATV